jgi:hypothetical protein
MRNATHPPESPGGGEPEIKDALLARRLPAISEWPYGFAPALEATPRATATHRCCR